MSDKKGLKITGDSDWQVDAVLNVFVRNWQGAVNQASFGFIKRRIVSNLKTTGSPFKRGLDQPTAAQITAIFALMHES